ncbi:uncharacterized protein LOC129228683 [Uloborus diversus]|uniref:uncharacterized protein LOC129228683 n=1 Tax=Uloborus diversus TaxID=327109 RepID=UPI002408F813|nr:uncharacterized protein LOC129228683 [Uloborus diversus]
MKISFLHLWYMFIVFQVCFCLRLRSLRIPESWPSGLDVELVCEFDLEGDTLYAIKWFHNGEEFYRFCPSEDPSTMFFPARGINLDVHRTTNTSVVLRDLERISTGYFRCEVLADAPHFQTVTAEAFMTVADNYSAVTRNSSSTFLIAVVYILIKFHHVRYMLGLN